MTGPDPDRMAYVRKIMRKHRSLHRVLHHNLNFWCKQMQSVQQLPWRHIDLNIEYPGCEEAFMEWIDLLNSTEHVFTTEAEAVMRTDAFTVARKRAIAKSKAHVAQLRDMNKVSIGKYWRNEYARCTQFGCNRSLF